MIGGIFGSLLGAGIAGRGSHFAGAVVGGAVGATAGAAVGASSGTPGGCPSGYVVASGAPTFVYDGPYAGPAYWAPGWYNPWFWDGGHWMYRPYRSWYHGYRGGYRGGYHGGYHGGYYHH